MYFKNEAGETYLIDNKIAVLNTAEGKYTYESWDPILVQSVHKNFVQILEVLADEEMILERLDSLISEDDD